MFSGGDDPIDDSAKGKSFFQNVNRHCLANIINLSEKRNIEASEDIFDTQGNKLWAKGKPISRELHDKLLRRKLALPLELSLAVDGGVMSSVIADECLKLIEEHGDLKSLAGTRGAQGFLVDFRKINLPGVVKLLLTSAKETQPQTYEHTLYTVVVVAGMAARANFNDHDAQLLIFSALTHDLGEMYINPDYLRNAGELTPHQWLNVAVHPRVGKTLIEELTNLHRDVAVSVGEHHERLDGSGYPGQMQQGMSQKGRFLAVADLASALLAQGGEAVSARISLGLRIVPEEFDHEIVNLITKPLGKAEQTAKPKPFADVHQQVSETLARLEAARQVVNQLLTAKLSKVATDNGVYVQGVLSNLIKALRSTGVVTLESLQELAQDEAALHEVSLIAREISWRLRNLARNVNLRAEAHGEQEIKNAAELISALLPPARTA